MLFVESNGAANASGRESQLWGNDGSGSSRWMVMIAQTPTTYETRCVIFTTRGSDSTMDTE